MNPPFPFEFDSTRRKSVNIWGSSEQALPLFCPEYLPAYFTRTLVIDKNDLAANSYLQWKLTGPDASLVIRLLKRELIVYLEYHDSMGLFPESEAFAANIWQGPKHPSCIKYERRVQLQQPVSAISLTVDRSLTASVYWGSPDYVSLPCTCDLLRSQLNLVGEGSVQGTLRSPDLRTATVTIHAHQRFQTIRGFGGIMSAPAWRQLSAHGKQQWLRIVQENNWLIQREYPTGSELTEDMDNWDCAADAMPHYYGDNFPNGESSDFEYNRAIQDLGGEVWFEFWLFPPWIQELKDNQYQQVNAEKFAAAILSYCQTAVAKTGKPPTIVGIQNEISPSEEDLGRMVPLLRKRLDEAGFQSVKIHMANCSSLKGGFEFLRRLKANPEAWKCIDYLAVNEYDAQRHVGSLERYAQELKRFKDLGEGREVLSPEISLPQPRFQGDGYRLAAMMAELFHYNLVEFEATALCYCWTLLDTEQPNYEATRSLYGLAKCDDFTPVRKGRIARAFNAYSKSLPKGSVRIAANCAVTDLLVSAWLLPDGQQRLIAFNRGTIPLQLSGFAHPSSTIHSDLYHEYTAREQAETFVVQPGGFTILTF
ncbi:MAG: hypothetical protein LR015_05340 [Verrucomicrobia bacterium]|nr:hypothetical protein [Verrucomicrobiota bacterium]